MSERSGVSAPPPKPRPPLPGGPYLVVGLARSGQAAARMLAARGEEVAGCDSASPEGAAGLAEQGLEVHLDSDGVELLAWSETKIMLRFWIIAAVCSGIGFTLYQQSIGT